jgi:hypothetical protein
LAATNPQQSQSAIQKAGTAEKGPSHRTAQSDRQPGKRERQSQFSGSKERFLQDKNLQLLA